MKDASLKIQLKMFLCSLKRSSTDTYTMVEEQLHVLQGYFELLDLLWQWEQVFILKASTVCQIYVDECKTSFIFSL